MQRERERVEPSATGPVRGSSREEGTRISTHRHTTLMLLPAAALMAARWDADAGVPVSLLDVQAPKARPAVVTRLRYGKSSEAQASRVARGRQ